MTHANAILTSLTPFLLALVVRLLVFLISQDSHFHTIKYGEPS